MPTFYSIASGHPVFYSEEDTTALQPLEGTLLIRAEGAATFVMLSSDDRFLAHKCDLLYRSDAMVRKVRYPYFKLDPLQEYVYERKYADAVSHRDWVNLMAARAKVDKFLHNDEQYQMARYMASKEQEAYELSFSSKLPYLADEVAILNKPAIEVALEIIRKRQEREEVLRYSEKARRYFADKICRAKTTNELTHISAFMIERNYKLDCQQ